MPTFAGNGSINVNSIDGKKFGKMLEGGFLSTITDGNLATLLTNVYETPVTSSTLRVQPKIGEDTVVVVTYTGAIPTGAKTVPNSVDLKFQVIDGKEPMFNIDGAKSKVAKWLLRGL